MIKGVIVEQEDESIKIVTTIYSCKFTCKTWELEVLFLVFFSVTEYIWGLEKTCFLYKTKKLVF